MRRFSFLRLLVIAAVAFLGLQASAQSKLDKKVLMTIGDQDITVKEFTDVYNKNNLKDEVVEKKSIDEYLDLFINFRMKVMEAYEMQLDTNPKFKKELNGYRKQLAKPYFTNDEISEELVEEAYQRKLKDIRASHILITCDKHALPSDTLKAYNKALDTTSKPPRPPRHAKATAATSATSPCSIWYIPSRPEPITPPKAKSPCPSVATSDTISSR